MGAEGTLQGFFDAFDAAVKVNAVICRSSTVHYQVTGLFAKAFLVRRNPSDGS